MQKRMLLLMLTCASLVSAADTKDPNESTQKVIEEVQGGLFKDGAYALNNREVILKIRHFKRCNRELLTQKEYEQITESVLDKKLNDEQRLSMLTKMKANMLSAKSFFSYSTHSSVEEEASLSAIYENACAALVCLSLGYRPQVYKLFEELSNRFCKLKAINYGEYVKKREMWAKEWMRPEDQMTDLFIGEEFAHFLLKGIADKKLIKDLKFDHVLEKAKSEINDIETKDMPMALQATEISKKRQEEYRKKREERRDQYHKENIAWTRKHYGGFTALDLEGFE